MELSCCLAWKPHRPADGSLARYLSILRVLLLSDLAHPDHILLAPKGQMQLCRVISTDRRLRSCDTNGSGGTLYCLADSTFRIIIAP